MSYLQLPRPPSRRSPLRDAPERANTLQHPHSISADDLLKTRQEGRRHDSLLQVAGTAPAPPRSQGGYYPPTEFQQVELPNPSAPNPRISTISREHAGMESNRNSQISTVSTNASDGKRIKACIGPWKLGKTLGKGATARVRLARNVYTGQEAAIKIVQKRNAQMSQAGSLAALDQAESTLAESEDGIRRMPIGIEREVAIMKLIQHPNIMKLYDIWENRTEM
jgi:serine/threonine-protein kinase HSL1 (negative regulator of Swe1 kinase)